jgi:glutamine synthetase
VQRLRDWVSENLVDTVIVAGIDLQGRLYGKRCAADVFLRQNAEGIRTCDCNFGWDLERMLIPNLTFTGWHTGYGDMVAAPDWETLRMYPWFPKTALVICDTLMPDGNPVPIAPMSILRKQIARAGELGFTVKAASELEFFLFRETPRTSRQKDYDGLEPVSDFIGDYCIYRSSLDEWLIGDIRRFMGQANVEIECSKAEWGRGQHEINLVFADAMDMAARHAIFKQGVREMAAMKGAQATFMAKWNSDHSSSGCHVHMSLWRDGKPAFAGDAMPDVMRHFLGGMMALARDLQLFYSPTINSYKRYGDLTFAPSTISWGGDNRTVAFRSCGHGASARLENRIPGADVNPYLAYAAMLASGIYGIENKIEPVGECVTGNGYASDCPRLHRNLIEAVQAFKSSDIARQLFGNGVVEHYAAVAQWEIDEFMNYVTDWERRRYFEQI